MNIVDTVSISEQDEQAICNITVNLDMVRVIYEPKGKNFITLSFSENDYVCVPKADKKRIHNLMKGGQDE